MIQLDVTFNASDKTFGPFEKLQIPADHTETIQLRLTTVDANGDEITSGQVARFVGTKSPCKQVPPPPNSPECDAYRVPVSEITYKLGDSGSAPRVSGAVTEVSVLSSGADDSWDMEVTNPGPDLRYIGFRVLIKLDSIQYASSDPTIILQPSM